MNAMSITASNDRKIFVGSALVAAAVAGGIATLTMAVNAATSSPSASASTPITTAEVRAAQNAWGQGIVDIGEAFQSGADYEARAAQHIEDLYAYGQSEVLFKPTLAAQDQFRESFDEALSYFVKGKVSEDKGFAIKPWSKVRFGEQEIVTDADSAIAMGNYYFTPVGSTEETKVEFTFGYYRDDAGQLRINVHHSSLPHNG